MTSTSCSIRKPPSRRSASSPTSYVSTLKKGRTKSIPSTPTMTRRVVRSDSRCPTRVSSAVKSTSSSLRVGSSFLASSAPSSPSRPSRHVLYSFATRTRRIARTMRPARVPARAARAARANAPSISDPSSPPAEVPPETSTASKSCPYASWSQSPRRPARVMKSGTSRSSDNVAMASSQK